MIAVEKRLKQILSSPSHDVQLRKLSIELGCSLESTYEANGKHCENEVVPRIRDAARSQRDTRLYWIVVLSALASMLSALAAWCSVWRAVRP